VGRGHSAGRRRASMRVRNTEVVGGGRKDQAETWRRVGEYDVRFGANPTASYTEHANRGAGDVARLVQGIRPWRGQVGVVIGIAGQPVMAEVFDNPLTLSTEFDSILAAAGLDALGQPDVRTPSGRAFRFVDRVSVVRPRPRVRAGAGVSVEGSSEYVTVTGLAWQRGVVHLKAVSRAPAEPGRTWGEIAEIVGFAPVNA